MRLTTKRGKTPAKVALFEVDKRRIAEVTEIFNTVAITTEGEQSALAKAATEAISKALAAIEAAAPKPKQAVNEMPGQKHLIPLGEGGDELPKAEDPPGGESPDATGAETTEEVTEGVTAEPARPPRKKK